MDSQSSKPELAYSVHLWPWEKRQNQNTNFQSILLLKQEQKMYL